MYRHTAGQKLNSIENIFRVEKNKKTSRLCTGFYRDSFWAQCYILYQIQNYTVIILRFGTFSTFNVTKQFFSILKHSLEMLTDENTSYRKTLWQIPFKKVFFQSKVNFLKQCTVSYHDVFYVGSGIGTQWTIFTLYCTF